MKVIIGGLLVIIILLVLIGIVGYVLSELSVFCNTRRSTEKLRNEIQRLETRIAENDRHNSELIAKLTASIITNTCSINLTDDNIVPHIYTGIGNIYVDRDLVDVQLLKLRDKNYINQTLCLEERSMDE